MLRSAWNNCPAGQTNLGGGGERETHLATTVRKAEISLKRKPDQQQSNEPCPERRSGWEGRVQQKLGTVVTEEAIRFLRRDAFDQEDRREAWKKGKNCPIYHHKNKKNWREGKKRKRTSRAPRLGTREKGVAQVCNGKFRETA